MRPRSHVKALIDEDGAVLLDLRSDVYFAMNEVAAEIWRALDAGMEEDEIVRAIHAQYDVDRATISAQVSEFLTALLRDDLIESDG